MAAYIGVLVLVFAGVLADNDKPLPDFGKVYQIGGNLQLPYAEINEPFYAYYDANAGKSRVDYYNSLVVTIQRPDQDQYGKNYKIAPMSNYQTLNQKTCFLTNGTANATVTIQAPLPDLSGFQYVRSEMMSGVKCDVWQKIEMVEMKKNVYALWIEESSQQPIRYEMHGYDSLLGSHYDKYYIDYVNFDNTNPIAADVFEVPGDLKCGGFPGPGMHSENLVLSNPMREYIHNYDNHVHELFDNFKRTHKREYEHEREHEQRKANFRHNLRYIHSKSRAGLTYTMTVNHLADRSGPELVRMRGLKHSKGYNGGQPFEHKLKEYLDLPDQIDWRLFGAVTPVKDQAVCGSCWSFGTTGTIEGALFMKTGYQVRLSQQQLIDCSWGEGNNGCDGGEDYRAYQWIMRTGGLTSEEQYGDYIGQDGLCKSDHVTPVAHIKSYINVTSGNTLALKLAIAKFGPISVGIDASHRSLSFYSSGVYYEPECRSDVDGLDHAVLAVGYGVLNGEPYWLIKNSWSTYWGNDGYVLMSQKNNNCGVTTAATYVILD